MDLRIVSREDWGAKLPNYRVPIDNAAWYVVIRLTDKDPCFDSVKCKQEVQYLQTRDMSYSHPDIRFNFLIGGDGCVYEGRGWGIVPKLPRRLTGMTLQSVYIGIMGKFTRYPPPESMYYTTDELIVAGVKQHHITSKFLHITI